MSNSHSSSTSHFFSLRDRVEQEIAASISGLGKKTALRDAVEYALTSGGKRLRPIIVFMIAEAIEKGFDVSAAALSVECFHTASLIVDDLPCMDNDDERRNRPSLHKVYGESIALLASYALISAAFQKIAENARQMKEASPEFAGYSDIVCQLALEHAAKCAGIAGATAGQFSDLFPPSLTYESIREMVFQKTITLFEVCFVFGWLFGGGDIEKLNEVKKASHHLGMAFQIADDLKDLIQDESKQREMNFARFLGKQRAQSLFEKEMELFRETMHSLEIYTPSFERMCNFLISSTS